MLPIAPPEITLYILQYSDPRSALNLGAACKTYHELLNQDIYWKDLLKNTGKTTYCLLVNSNQSIQWKAAYIEYYCKQRNLCRPLKTSTDSFVYEKVFLSNGCEPILYEEGGDTFLPSWSYENSYSARLTHLPNATIKLFNNDKSLKPIVLESLPQRFPVRQIRQILYHPSFIALGLSNGNICTYDSKGRFTKIWKEHQAAATDLRCQQKCLYSSSKNLIHVRSLIKLSLCHVLKHDSSVTCFDITSSGDVMSGTSQGTILAWHKDNSDRYTSRCIKIHQQAVTCLKILASLMASGDKEGNLFLYCLSSNKTIGQIKLSRNNKPEPIHDVAFDKNSLVTLSTEMIRIWNINQLTCLQSISLSACFKNLVLKNHEMTALSFSAIKTIQTKQASLSGWQKIANLFEGISAYFSSLKFGIDTC